MAVLFDAEVKAAYEEGDGGEGDETEPQGKVVPEWDEGDLGVEQSESGGDQKS